MLLLLLGTAALVAFSIWYFKPGWPRIRQILSAVGITAIIAFLIRVGLGRLVALFGILSAFAPIINHLFFRHVAKKSAPHATALSRKDAAEILGVSETATHEEIEAAYRKLMTRVHPDTGGSAPLARQLNEARELLLRH